MAQQSQDEVAKHKDIARVLLSQGADAHEYESRGESTHTQKQRQRNQRKERGIAEDKFDKIVEGHMTEREVSSRELERWKKLKVPWEKRGDRSIRRSIARLMG